jgi:flagellar biosynthesis/type III secretory pathway protein FliH
MSFEKMYEEAKQGYYELGKEDGWNAGREDGWNAGRQDGWNAGREDGWNAGREDGWNAGRQSGLDDVIPIMISSFKEFGLSDDDIKEKLISKLNLSADEVQNYLNKFSS